MALYASGCVLHGGCRAGVRGRSRTGDGADDRGIDRELGTMPHALATTSVTTSMRLESLTGISMFMSATRTFPPTRAPASRHTSTHGSNSLLYSGCAERKEGGAGGVGAATRGGAPMGQRLAGTWGTP